MKTDTMWMIAAFVIVAIYVSNQQATPVIPPPPNNGGGDIDICKLVESEASFTGQRMFLAGTALTGEWVRVIKDNGDGTIKDKGKISMDSGTTDTSPGKKYKLYYGENSSTYYTQPEYYTAPCNDAADDKVGTLCTMDTTPTITLFDEYGRPSTAGSNTQAIGSGESVEVSLQVKVSADQCYGNPNAKKKNAICFGYNSTVYDSVSTDTTPIDTPYIISTNSIVNRVAGTITIDCFELPLLEDMGKANLDVVIKAASGKDPSVGDNISVTINDIAFDLDATTLEEIWDFEDEDNNELGHTSITAPVDFDIS